MGTFIDRLQASIDKTGSVLVAGCDPVIENLPPFLVESAQRKTSTTHDLIRFVLDHFCEIFIESVKGAVAAVKPNSAFFEQYGLPGLTAFERFCRLARECGIPVIADAKRGDIGSTAAAYSAAFLGRTTVGSHSYAALDVDAVTVNPFLGFDTLEPFMTDAVRYEKGIFVLVHTSNPGAKDIQALESGGRTVSEHIAEWIARNSDRLRGACGWSGLGAVVGASFAEQAVSLRALLPDSAFLIPGFGAQGGSAQDAVAGFGAKGKVRGGGIVNASRALIPGDADNAERLGTGLRERCRVLSEELAERLS